MLEYDIENEELDYSMEEPEEFGFDTPKTEVNKDYNKLENQPQLKVKEAVLDNDQYTIEEKIKIIENIKTLLDYGIEQFIPLDLSPYNTSGKKFIPLDNIEDGAYIVTGSGNIDVISDWWPLTPGVLLYVSASSQELTIVGVAGVLYYYYDGTTEQYEGGYPITMADLLNELANYNKLFTIKRNGLATGNISISSDIWFMKTRTTGITKGVLVYPNETTIDDYNFKARFSFLTSTVFESLTYIERDYNITFVGADCNNGVFMPKPGLFYIIDIVSDGRGGLINYVKSSENWNGEQKPSYKLLADITVTADNQSKDTNNRPYVDINFSDITYSKFRIEIVNPSNYSVVQYPYIQTLSGLNLLGYQTQSNTTKYTYDIEREEITGYWHCKLLSQSGDYYGAIPIEVFNSNQYVVQNKTLAGLRFVLRQIDIEQILVGTTIKVWGIK